MHHSHLKPTLDPNPNPERFHQFTGLFLTFFSRISERVVANHLCGLLCNNGLSEVCQSAFRVNHSINTAPARVTNNLLNE